MAKILRIHPDNPQDNVINEVVTVLKNGGLIIYPSDTVYALGCNIFDIRAMEKLAKLTIIKSDTAHFSVICVVLRHLSKDTKPIHTAAARFLRRKPAGRHRFVVSAKERRPLAHKGYRTAGSRVP